MKSLRGKSCDDDDDDDRHQRCQEIVQRCHAQFDVPTLTSFELLHTDTSKLMIVDVRTVPERRISQIPGSISLVECFEKLRLNPSETVALYCTVGYRSGLEAVHMQHYYPDATIFNLDGILAYSHAVSTDERSSEFQQLHTFGEAWDLAPSAVSTTHFRGIVLAFRLLQVGWTSFLRKAERLMNPLLFWRVRNVSARRGNLPYR